MSESSKKLILITEDLRHYIPREKINLFLELLDNDLAAVAFKFLCDWLKYFNVQKISEDVYNTLEEVGECLFKEKLINRKIWMDLKKLTK